MGVTINEIAIIGAGLGGAALALSLSSVFPECKISVYETRPASALTTISSGVILTPNGLAILDNLNILQLIADKCYTTTYRCFKDRDDNTTSKTITALQEQYGYTNHRLWRKLLLDTMLTVLGQRSNVTVLYEWKLAKIHDVAPDHHGVSFDIEGVGSQNQPVTTIHTDLLVGADGLYSTVRQYLHPGSIPEYTGATALVTHIPRTSVAWPYDDYERNATIQDIPGAILFLPEDANGETIIVGRQFTDIPHSLVTDRVAFEKLQNNKQALCDMFRQRYDEFGTTSKKILDSIKKYQDQIFLWPFMKIPELPTWYRQEDGRVLIVGDAAHAIPPSSGQGVNQVLEDVWMLTLLLSGGSRGTCPPPALERDDLVGRLRFWQVTRQARIDRICDWTANVQNVERMSQAERDEVKNLHNEKEAATGTSKPDSSVGDDMAWLYTPCIDDEVRLWFKSQGK